MQSRNSKVFRWATTFSVVLAMNLGAIGTVQADALFFKRGDTNSDDNLDISDAVSTLDFLFLGGAEPTCKKAADTNDDGNLDLSDGITTLSFLFLGGAPPAAPYPDCGEDPTPDPLTCVSYEPCPQIFGVVRTSPARFEDGVALTRETIVELGGAVDPATATGDAVFATFAGEVLPARVHLSPSRDVITLFYESPLPSSARIRLTVDGNLLLAENGLGVDADGDGEAGGIATTDFETLALATLPGTAVVGRVFASVLRQGGNGEPVNLPLNGVTISVDGLEEVSTTTDAKGSFRLENAPVGRFFVHINGKTAIADIPDGAYYPNVGKSWQSFAGSETSVGNVYLPLIAAGTLQPVSNDEPTTITFPASVLEEFPELEGVAITVPAGSLFANDGEIGGSVGIAPVPADRLPGQLPAILNFALVITVQTDGATNFDEPVPVCFPNLPDPSTGEVLAAGDKSALWSFNHDTGRFEVIGPMTVSADGTLVCTDEGVGILAPGWHGTDPGSEVEPEDPDCPDLGWGDAAKVGKAVLDCAKNLTRFLQILSTAVDVISNVNSLVTDINRLRQGYGDGTLTLKEVKAAINALKATKESVKSVYETWTAQNPVNKAIEIIKCVNGIVKSINDVLCARKECMGAVGQFLCDRIVPLINFANTLLDKAEDLSKSIREAPVTAVCLSFDALLTALDVAGDGDAAEDGGGAGAAGPDPDLLAKLDAVIADGQAFVEGNQSVVETSELTETHLVTVEEISSEGTGVALGFSGLIPNAHYVFDSGGTQQRGKTNGAGRFRLLVGPNQEFEMRILGLQEGIISVANGTTPRNGRRGRITPTSLVSLTDAIDSDGDGLPDEAEFVVGTLANNADSDGDGIGDGAEVEQGTDPLDCLPGGPCLTARTGLIATANTPGTTTDVCAVNDVAITANLTGGVSVFNVFAGLNPTLIAQIDTPGTANAVACSGELIAVADGVSGLQIIDISDPGEAHIARSISQRDVGGSATAVAASGALAYVGTSNGRVSVIDMASGAIVRRRSFSGGPVHDLGIGGDSLYVLASGRLHQLNASDGSYRSLGSAVANTAIGAGGRRPRLFIGTDTAYSTFTSGYNIFALGASPALVRSCDTAQFGWKHLIDNGSGTGIAAVSPNSTDDGPHHISLLELGDDLTCSPTSVEFETPGLAAAVANYNGLAYVADSAAGLQVINYLSFDAQGEAPQITLNASFPLDGIVEEGKILRVSADVTDDVQVRSVEFYVDGTRVLTDGAFPFEHRLTSPLAETQDSMTFQAVAKDTGGNATWTEEFVVEVRAELTPPSVTSVSPEDAETPTKISALTAFFSEPVNVSPEQFTLSHAGKPVDGALSVVGSTATLSFDEPLPVGSYTANLSGDVRDLAGNRLGVPMSWSFDVIVPPYELYVTSGAGVVGDTVDVTVLANNELGMQGWTFGICHDTDLLAISAFEGGIDALTARNGRRPEFWVLDLDLNGGGIGMAAAIEIAGPTQLPAAEGHELLQISYEILSGSDDGSVLTTDLCPCETIELTAGNPIESIFTVDGSTATPEKICGQVVIQP